MPKRSRAPRGPVTESSDMTETHTGPLGTAHIWRSIAAATPGRVTWDVTVTDSAGRADATHGAEDLPTLAAARAVALEAVGLPAQEVTHVAA